MNTLSCVSLSIYERWKASGIIPTAVHLTTTQQSQTHVEIQWGVWGREFHSSENPIEFNPGLAGCNSVTVLAASSDEVQPAVAHDLVITGFSSDPEVASFHAWKMIDSPSCKVLVVLGTLGPRDEPRFYVSTLQKGIGTMRLETEPNNWWLTLLPFGVALDIATAPVSAAAAFVLWQCTGPESYLCLGGLATTH